MIIIREGQLGQDSTAHVGPSGDKIRRGRCYGDFAPSITPIAPLDGNQRATKVQSD